MEHFYIMNADCLFDGKAATIEDTIGMWEDETILVAQRERGYNRYSRIFVSGSDCEESYGVKAGDHASYTQDTGMGYRNRDKHLKIENTILIQGGKIVHKDNDIGLNEKRRVWVMK